ncbi:MAG: hypothetical protein ACM3SR_00780 [Ignavibacteriales bacterium]
MTEVGTTTIKMRAYYSSYHLWAANHFVQLGVNIETAHSGKPIFIIEHRTYVTNAIFSSVAFMEAAINEIFQDATDNHQSYISPLDADTQALMVTLWDLTEERNRSAFSVLDKYQIALTFAREKPFPKGDLLYQDTDLVIKLRNELVHYKPKTLGGSDIHKFENSLRGKFPLNALMNGSGNPFFPDKCLGYGCAQWAVNSCKNYVDTFFAKLGIIPNYERVKF